uniref:AlNc14C175G8111 protein n=1 Tax=Albugo laibachii Nc14 TaxID=890382 RepID=F0WNV1_9STRA|nr:AlNc14C175G8111 [Albugo laibachii Nc14]|eukprot:CCA22994.1 AlNc14C175G8111 [Albugo laibachii Nc14]
MCKSLLRIDFRKEGKVNYVDFMYIVSFEETVRISHVRPNYPTSGADKARGSLAPACSSRLTNSEYILNSLLLLPTSAQNIRGVVNAVCELDPKNYGEAMMSQRKHKWMTAVSEELKALKETEYEKVGYILNQEVSIDLLLKDYEWETANEVRAPIVEEFNDCNSKEPKYLPSTAAANCNGSVMEFQSLGESTNEQAYYGRLEDGEAYLERLVMPRLKAVSNSNFAANKWLCEFVVAQEETGVSLSTMEAEFIAASKAGRELSGLRELFQELSVKIAEPMKMKKMKVDNEAAIKQLECEKNHAYYGRGGVLESVSFSGDLMTRFVCHRSCAPALSRFAGA